MYVPIVYLSIFVHCCPGTIFQTPYFPQILKVMNKFVIYLALTFLTTSLYGQVTVTGHISAEIIDGVEVSPKMSGAYVVNLLSEKIELGEISLSCDEVIACNVILGSGRLIDINGNGIAMETTVAGNEKILRFSASTRNLRGKKTKLYEGSFSVLLFYE